MSEETKYAEPFGAIVTIAEYMARKGDEFFTKGTKQAGTDARNAMAMLSHIGKAMRGVISDIKNGTMTPEDGLRDIGRTIQAQSAQRAKAYKRIFG